MSGKVNGSYGYDDSPMTTIRSYVQNLNIGDSQKEKQLIAELSTALSISADTEIGQYTIGETLRSNSLWNNTIKPDAIGDLFHRTQNQQEEPKVYKGDLPYPEGVVYDGEIAHHNAQNHRWQDGQYISWALNGIGHAIDKAFRGVNPF